MSTKNFKNASPNAPSAADGLTAEGDYRTVLHTLQVELVKLQKHFIRCDDKVLVLIEGRDAVEKDGVIKRIVRHQSRRETRVAALGKPSDR